MAPGSALLHESTSPSGRLVPLHYQVQGVQSGLSRSDSQSVLKERGSVGDSDLGQLDEFLYKCSQFLFVAKTHFPCAVT